MTDRQHETPLEAEDLLSDPMRQFEAWYEEARELSGLAYPNAMSLATVAPDGFPEGRIVLLKEMDGRGFVFFTNLDSPKARSLKGIPRAALTFYWEPLRRQVRVQGEVEEVSPEESDAYFRTRPRGSQIGAWASDQSAPLQGRSTLESRFAELEARFAEQDSVPRPPHWGGLRVVPRAIEFWQERMSRLHDRFLFRRGAAGVWEMVRLSP
jgi:pyridoxamine 5'-phosphate oxidase